MEAKIKEGEKARNDLITSRKRYESDTKTQIEKINELEEGSLN